jgi:hypothetical protein
MKKGEDVKGHGGSKGGHMPKHGKDSNALPVPDGTTDEESKVPPPVSNRTAGDDQRTVAGYVARCRGFQKQTATGWIGLGQTLFEAESESHLPKEQMKQVCAEGCFFEYAGSTYRKFKKIGEEAPRFEPYIDRMPGNWTVLYLLAHLSKAEFGRVVDHKLFGQSMTEPHIRSILSGKAGAKKDAAICRDITLGLNDLDRARKAEYVSKLNDLNQEFGVQMSMSRSLSKELTPTTKGKPTQADIGQALLR